ncbi:hypothetical protein [Cyclobacterium sp. SYSU L10401]|uniref:hypothetical protein n=1 Tax=Cyclobacterium sp. SYSU L10401 TaxID=2678657 RepID=UPI0013D37A35|nr:hypothetical protein [Cyclobacterium sp. SYSU L10401]
MQKIKSYLGQRLINFLGWKTNRKIIVIESDDWGGISMPSKDVYDNLLKNHISVDKSPYSRFDSLASTEDLETFFETLSKYHDKYGNPPIITANTNVANPDFEKIKQSGFEKYFYEPFTKTLERYPDHKGAFALWKQGIKENVFLPQFHGREHLNPMLWLNELKEGKNPKLHIAFDLGCFILPKDNFIDQSKIYNTAFYPYNQDQRSAMLKSIPDGLDLFEKLLGYKAESFIATGYFWNHEIEKLLYEKGITSLQGLPIQKESILGRKHKKKLNYTGKYNKYGQVYLVRNVFFEPSLKPRQDSIDQCLKRIKVAFDNKKPAIISTHRLNFVGYINRDNRIRNITLLNKLLRIIVQKWPDIEFMSSNNLANSIIKTRNGR